MFSILATILVQNTFSRLGIKTPTVIERLDLSPRAISFTRNSRSLIATAIASRFCSRTLPPLRYLEIVAIESPVRFATSFMVTAILGPSLIGNIQSGTQFRCHGRLLWTDRLRKVRYPGNFTVFVPQIFPIHGTCPKKHLTFDQTALLVDTRQFLHFRIRYRIFRRAAQIA